MATFHLSKKSKKDKQQKNIKKVVGASMLGVASVVFLFSATGLWPWLQGVLLGIFGVMVYPLCVLSMIIGLALLNNRKYVMSKRYAVFLALSVTFLVAIIQLAIVGDKVVGQTHLNFWQYLQKNYTQTWTAGGFLIGILTTCAVMPLNLAGAYVLFSLALVISVAFFVEALVSYRKSANLNSPVKINISQREKRAPKDERAKALKPKEEVDVVMNGQVQDMLFREQEEKRRFGMSENMRGAYSSASKENLRAQAEEKPLDKKSAKEILLQPPTVDMQEFFARSQKINNLHNRQSVQMADKQKIDQQFEEMKADQPIKPAQQFFEEQFDFVTQQKPIKRGNLPEIKPEELLSEADNIIMNATREELADMGAQKDDDFLIRQDDATTPQNEAENAGENNMDTNFTVRTDGYLRDTTGFARGSTENGIDEQTFVDFGDDDNSNFANLGNDLSRDNLTRENLSRDNLTRDRENLSRDNFGRENLTRDRENLTNRENLTSRDISNRENLGARDLTRGANDEKSDRALSRDRNFDLSRSKGADGVKDRMPKEEEKTFKPYKYNRPSIDLITTQSDDLSIFNDEVPQKRVALENALETFGIPAKVQSVVIGPTVTRYEMAMPEGISVKKILSLDADIAYTLSAKGQILIEAPVPGRSIVGIQVPNNKVAKVSIKDVLMSKEFTMSPSPLVFALGKDIAGTVRVCNLAKMPHLLVAGTTGSGKSVCLNSIIVSMLYKASPDEVKFIMIDPKQVELSMYEGLPHMVIPKVITDPTKAVNALQWAVDEMERRFNLISEARVRNIDEYNKIEQVVAGKKKKMPYLVIIFDEFADFMQVAKNEIEDKIMRLAQKARAAGIHLILATQRPSTDVVTGTIKANFPARIAFKVAGRVDSEVILGSTGAEKLLGYGDMLYKPSDSAPARIQGCYIDTPETKDIVQYIIDNNEETYDEEAYNAINNISKAPNGGSDDSGMDALLPQALKICIDVGVASTTMVQRKLSIGYPRAARIIDQMEERGYISSAEGSKQRTVYTTIEEFYDIFGESYD